jgi:hypothetical protein
VRADSALLDAIHWNVMFDTYVPSRTRRKAIRVERSTADE